MTDFESRLKDAMAASVATVEPTFTVADVMRRHDNRVKRLAAMGLAVAVAMGVVAFFLPKQLGRVNATMTVEPLAGHTTSYIDADYGWSITYNRAWVEAGSTSGVKPNVIEAIRFANFRSSRPASYSHPESGSGSAQLTLGWLRAFPATGVALEVWNVATAVLRPRVRETAFPLQMARFTLARKFAGGSEPTPKVLMFFGDGIQFKAAVWVGRLASPASERAIWAAVRSIRFPPPRTGTIWQNRFYVLGLATSYRVDSVTLFPATSLPRGSLQRVGFYLVRSSRSFYIVQRRVLVAEPNLVYAVRYDARKRQFVASGTRLRWSLAGSPVGQVADLPLQVARATVSQDGHVLYAPDLAEYSAASSQIESVN